MTSGGRRRCALRVRLGFCTAVFCVVAGLGRRRAELRPLSASRTVHVHAGEATIHSLTVGIFIIDGPFCTNRRTQERETSKIRWAILRYMIKVCKFRFVCYRLGVVGGAGSRKLEVKVKRCSIISNTLSPYLAGVFPPSSAQSSTSTDQRYHHHLDIGNDGFKKSQLSRYAPFNPSQPCSAFCFK